MPKYRDPKYVVSSYFSHLSMLENNSTVLYDTLAEKASVPEVQSIMQKIASDGKSTLCFFKA